MDIATRGGADGEGGMPPSPVSTLYADICNPPPPALRAPPAPPRGGGQCVAIAHGNPYMGLCNWRELERYRHKKTLHSDSKINHCKNESQGNRTPSFPNLLRLSHPHRNTAL